MRSAHALIIDDEPDIRQLLNMTLKKMDITVTTAKNLSEGHAHLKQSKFDFCLTDMRLPDGDGLTLVEHVQIHYPDMPIAVFTAHGNMETAIIALKHGAFDFVTKPIDLSTLRNLVTSALKLRQSHQAFIEDDEAMLVGESTAILDLKATVMKVARSHAPVYISGPSGSGKELVARLIHKNSPRFDQGFVPVNSGAIPANLMESEFFGHKKGSFTGANVDKTGLFQAAHHGTLFLDEVADLPLEMQVKLLRAIQEKAVRPIGSPKELAVDVRIISATHHDLQQQVMNNLFRQDLFYRLNVIELKVPALAERLDDIPLLADYLINKICLQAHLDPVTLCPTALKALQSYTFPGNVRELENILERAIALCENQRITAQDLQLPTHSTAMTMPPTAEVNDLENYLDTMERQAIESTLQRTQGNKTEAAKILGISFRALRYRLKKLGLSDHD